MGDLDMDDLRGRELALIIGELLEMAGSCREEPYVDDQKITARKLGQELYDFGGFRAMQQTYYVIRDIAGPFASVNLNYAWHELEEWRS